MDAARHAAVAALMNPRSVAIVGATERADASSSYVMKNLIAKGFAGRIHPVHPKAGTVFGHRAHPSLADLPEPADVAVIGIAADRAVAALDDAGRAGTKAAVVLASGFAETGPEGAALQVRLVEVAHRHGMAVCGPNCLGLLNLSTGAALYSSSLSSTLRTGALAILSHSGASAIALANSGRLGLSHIVSAGNGAVTDIPDYIAFLASDPGTRAIGLVLEAIRAPADFAEAMQLVHAAGKPVFALRAGRSATGARATAAHTGALAGANDAYEAFFRRCGVIEVADMDAFVQMGVLATTLRGRPKRPGIAVVGVSGGGVAHVADIADEVGLALPVLAPGTVEALRELLPAFASPQNPLDTTGIAFADGGIYRRALEIAAADPAIGLVVAAQDAPAGLDDACAAEYHGIAEAWADFARASQTPTVFMSNLAAGHHPSVDALTNGLPVLAGTRAALAAVKALMVPPHAAIVPAGEAPRDDDWARRLASGAPLTEREAKTLLAGFGLPVTQEALATSADEAAEIAARIGFPVAMKIESPDIAHKTEAGGVRLHIGDAEAARRAFAEIMANAAAYDPQAHLSGVLVQEMVPQGVEAVVGLVRHEPFGLGIVVGVGGVLVELVKDAAFDLLPLDRAGAEALISRTRLDALLNGYRGSPPADRSALVNVLLGLSRFAAARGEHIEAVDLNPVVVLSKGARVVDALILPRASAPSTAYSGPPLP
jgi:acyl-CoA synthetase (NDP forming)